MPRFFCSLQNFVSNLGTLHLAHLTNLCVASLGPVFSSPPFRPRRVSGSYPYIAYSSTMAPLILHNVPDDECYVGEDGIKRPYAMIYP